MREHEASALSGVILEHTEGWTLDDVCGLCRVEQRWVISLVDEGVVEPAGGSRPPEWRFPGDAVVRVQRAARLMRDLGLNAPGAALALELMEQLGDSQRP
ncbi:chaperone modulator CbpM [Arhodomonas sp. SL1]|uniref:chaperone modulator CbpM n=1 Tax=Arhodomonas sp. SL1 TaxID=3425691 RepID=UPI003F885C96